MRLMRDTVSVSADPATAYSKPLDLSNCSSGSFQVSWSATTPTIAETVWATNNPNADESNDDDWVDVTSAVAAVDVTGSSGKGFIDIPPAECLYDRYRLKFVRSAGSATITIHGSGKPNR